MTVPAGAARRLTVVPLIAALYFIVSGGPYGLEDLIAATGYERALLLLFLTPILWSLPISLILLAVWMGLGAPAFAVLSRKRGAPVVATG